MTNNRYSKAFNLSFENVIGVEGGYTQDPEDTGNWTGGRKGVGKLNGTKYGVSAASYPFVDIKSLTIEDAKTIYYNDFWTPIKGDSVPFAIANVLFDCAINSGCTTSVKLLQRALGLKEDGVIGNATITEAINNKEALTLYLTARAVFYSRLSKFELYGKGWMKRLFIVHQQSLLGNPA